MLHFSLAFLLPMLCVCIAMSASVCFHALWLIFIVDLFLLFFKRLSTATKFPRKKERKKIQSDDRKEENYLLFLLEKNLCVFVRFPAFPSIRCRSFSVAPLSASVTLCMPTWLCYFAYFDFVFLPLYCWPNAIDACNGMHCVLYRDRVRANGIECRI